MDIDAKKQRQKPNLINVLIGVLILGLMGFVLVYFIYLKPSDSPNYNPDGFIPAANLTDNTEPIKKGVLKNFSGEEFRELYNNFAYPNTDYIEEDAVITSDKNIDRHIQNLAEKRGYLRRSAPVTDTFNEVQKGITLQQRATQPWIDLKTSAKKDGIGLTLTAGYRSSTDQRSIFLQILDGYKINKSRITEGIYDKQILETLSTTAIPGYSRHHTGYTIDIGCENQPNLEFKSTVCFEWLKADNYKNAKLYGWIPSYPEGASMQGPEPESWEYVWVGTDAVTE
jgi:LAS superfamily LD-carboxypeptidase LdcB